jgi:hypothetical protein
MIFSILRFANCAHGELAVVGAYLTYSFSVTLGVGLLLSAATGILCAGKLAVVLDHIVFRKIRPASSASSVWSPPWDCRSCWATPWARSGDSIPDGNRIAHGVLLMGYVSTVSGMVADRFGEKVAVTYGYDRVRFIKPVYIGDPITVRHEVTEYDKTTGFLRAQVTITNQESDVVAAALHIIKVL